MTNHPDRRGGSLDPAGGRQGRGKRASIPDSYCGGLNHRASEHEHMTHARTTLRGSRQHYHGLPDQGKRGNLSTAYITVKLGSTALVL